MTVEVETPPSLTDASRAAMEAFRDAAGAYNPRDRLLGEGAQHA